MSVDVELLVSNAAKRKGLSLRTIQTYNHCLRSFFRCCKRDPRAVRKVDVEQFLDRLVAKGQAGSSLNVNLNAIKFFYKYVLKRRILVELEFSKVPKRYPTFLTKKETKALITAITNPKHKLMIKLMYGAGLRVSELVKLKATDLDLDTDQGWIRAGKGNKDRPFKIPNNIAEELRGREGLLFTGRKSHLTVSSVRQILKKAAKRAKIKKNVHPHTLRHSFATHFMQDGNDLMTLQFLLGHNRLETSLKYAHMASAKFVDVQSPLDTL